MNKIIKKFKKRKNEHDDWCKTRYTGIIKFYNFIFANQCEM